MKNTKGLFGGYLPLILFFCALLCTTVSAAGSRKCHHTADIMIVVDSSGSVNLKTFIHQIRPFLRKLFKQITTVIRHPRTSLATFDRQFNHVLRFTYDKERVLSAINGMTYMGGVTALKLALLEATKYAKYFGRKGVDTILIAISDYHPTIGRHVRRVLRKMKKEFDIIIPIGITKSVNQYRMRRIAKRSGTILLTETKIRETVRRVVAYICQSIVKTCPPPIAFKPRCLGRHWLDRSVSYSRRQFLCLKRVHSDLRPVRCPPPPPSRIVCRHCQRLLLQPYWRVRGCKCVPRASRRRIGTCCCPKTRRRRNCLRTRERVTSTSFDFVNGHCWPRRVRCRSRCACPKSKTRKVCLGDHIEERTVKYVLTRDRQCLKIRSSFKAPIFCRFVSVSASHCFKKATPKGYVIVRKVRVVAHQVKGGCQCRSSIRVLLEPCKCKDGTRFKWTRVCRKDCKRQCKPGCFHEKTWFVYRLAKDGGGRYRCQPVPVVRRKYRCCCLQNRRRGRSCRGTRLVHWFSFSRLLSGKCVRISKVRCAKRPCCEGVISRRRVHHRGRLAAIIELLQFRRGCQCVRKKRTLYVRWACPKPSFRKACRKGITTFYRRFSYSMGRGCVTRRQRMSLRTYCPKHRKVVAASCYKGVKYVLFEKVFRVNCGCVVRLVKARRGYCRCQKNWASQWRCYRHRFYIRRSVTFTRDRTGQCVRRKAMVVKRLLGCRRHAWKTSTCNRRTGVLRVFYNLRRLRHCRCKKWRRLIHFARCNCKLINRKYAYKRKRYCDARRNEFVTEQTYFVYDKKQKTCVRKTRVLRQAVRCPRKVRTHVSRCDLVKRRRCVTRSLFRAALCRCLPVRRVSFEQCGCASKKVRVVCARKLGLLVREIHLKVWNRKLDRCDRTKRLVRIPVRCRRVVRVRRTPCNGKFYLETRIWFTRRKGSCFCHKRVKTRKINCYCPPRTRTTRCRGFYKFRVTRFMAWDPVSRRCKPSISNQFRLRCRCPKPRTVRLCRSGWRFVKRVRYALRKFTCVQAVSITRQAIFCTQDVRIRWSKCLRCHRIRTVLSRLPHPRTCRCVFRPNSRTRCRCCPCPRSRASRKCLRRVWTLRTVSFQPVRRGGCVRHCRKVVRVRLIRVSCPRRPRAFWTRCIGCRKRLIVHKQVWDRCRCRYRRVRTSRTKRCCCPKPFHTRKCRAGFVVDVNARYRLKKTCCLMVKSVLIHKKACPLIRVPVTVKPCNRRTCSQLILSAKLVLMPKTCKCKMVRVRRFRKCCCRRKGHSYTVCLGSCWLTRSVRYKFSAATRRCVRKSSTSRGCLRCRPPVVTRGRCNRASCFRFVFRTRFGLSGAAHFGRCRCRPHTTRRLERCCCPPASPWLRTCRRGWLLWRRALFSLRGAKCVRRAEVRRKLVRCRGRVARRQGKCRRPACSRCVTDVLERREGCRCVRFQRRRCHRCCCPPPVARRVCKRNNIIARVTRSFQLAGGRCVQKRRVRHIRKVTGCPSIKKLFKCDPKTKVRKGFVRHLFVRNCVCVPSRRGLRIAVPCGCPAPTVRLRPCLRPSCLRKRVVTFFRLVGKRCVRSRKARSEPCCCRKPLVRHTVRCNPRSGQKERVTLTRTFVRAAKRCVTLRALTSLGIGRNCLSGAVRILRGPCNTRSRLATDTFISFRHVRKTCRCVRRVRKRKRICVCPPCKRHRFCRHGVIVLRSTCFRLFAGSCHALTRSRRFIRRCPRNVRFVRRCRGCRGVLWTLFNVRTACRCVRRRRGRRIVCCCPPLARKVTCANPFLQTTVTGFVRDKARTKCVPVVLRRSRRVRPCRRARVLVSKCDRRTCKRAIFKLVFGLKRCRCRRLRRLRRLVTCCCPKPRSRKSCSRSTGVLTTLRVRYRLQNGACVRETKIVRKETRCDAVSVRVGPCQRGSRSIVIRGERRVHCSCRPTLRAIHQKCQCPASRVVKQPCHRHMWWRSVFLVFFRIVSVKGAQSCKRTVKKLYRERCKCPPPVVRRSCVNSKRVTDRTTFRLASRFGQRTCLSARCRTWAAVTCRPARVLRLRCFGCTRKVRRETWRPVKCKCRPFLSTRTEACNCHLKNSVKTKCLGSDLIRTVTSFKAVPGYKRCVGATRATIKHVVCPRKRTVPLSTGCTVHHYGAAYREFETVWFTKQGCSCRRHSRRVTGLCRCRRAFSTRRCMGASVKHTRHSFSKKGARCVRAIAVKVTPVSCPARGVRVRRGRCVKGWRRVRVTACRVRACRCGTTVRTVRQRCSAPGGARTRRFCDHKLGFRVTEAWRFVLRDRGLLLRWEGVTIARKVLEKETKQTKELVLCPAASRRASCNRATGVRTTEWVLWRRRGCKCEKRARRRRGSCRCPLPTRRAGRCIKGLRAVKVVFHVLHGGRCSPKVVRSRERCACPKGRVRRFCDRARGSLVTCATRTRFDGVRKGCSSTVVCRSKVVPCGRRWRVRAACNRRTGLRKVRIEGLVLRKDRCKCRRKILFKGVERCSCKHLNRKHRSCVRGRFSSYVTYRFVLSSGHCALRMRRWLKETVCPRRKTRLSRCITRGRRRGFCVERTFRYIVRKCRCQRRRSVRFVRCSCKYLRHCRPVVRRRCVRNVRIIRRSFCVLLLGKCRRRIKESVRELYCPKKAQARSGRCRHHPDGASYKLVTLYKLKLSGCKCVWVIVRKTKIVCKCPPPCSSSRCVLNRVSLHSTVRYFRHLSGSHCRAIVRSRAQPVRCPRTQKRTSPCSRKTCRLRVLVTRYVPVNCRCRRRAAAFFRTCCCPPPAPKRRSCAQDGRTIVLRSVRFSLALGRCFPLPCVETRRLRCERRRALVRVGPCRAGHRRRCVTSFHTRRCRCVRRKRVTFIRCGCPRKVLVLRGKCKGSFATDQVVSFRLRAKKCVRVALRRRRRCRCPPPRRLTFCARHNVRTTKFITFRLVGGSCARRVVRRSRLLDGCDRRPSLVRTQRGLCRGRRRTVRVIFTVARRCRCGRIVRKRTEGCNCYRPARRLRRCLRKRLMVTDTLHFLKKGRRCVVARKRRKRTIDCFGRRTSSSSCRGRPFRVIRVWRRVARRCRCVWRLVRSRKALCRCPRPRIVRSCVRHRWHRVTRLSFALRGGRCLRRVATALKEVCCDAGRFRLVTKCSPSGVRVITHLTRRLRHCRCLETRRRRRCRCRCPKPSRTGRCFKRTGVRKTIDVTFRLRRCGCQKLRRVRTVRVRCGPPLRHVEPCRKAAGGNSYRAERVTLRKRAGCECRRIFRKRSVLCRCAPRPLRVTRCKDGCRLVTIKSRFVRKGKRCIRVRTRVKVRRVVCGRSKKVAVCKGKVKIVTIRHRFVQKCRCREAVKIIKGRCKCPVGRRLVRKGPCVRCMRGFTFAAQRLVGLRCVTRLLHRRQRCCCPKKALRSQTCNKATGVITMTTRTLRFVAGRCVWQKAVRRRKLRCSRRHKRHVLRRRDGFEVVTVETSRRAGCACRPHRRRFLRRWACPHPRFQFSCTKGNKWLRRAVHFRLTKGRCVRLARAKLIPVLCKFNRKWVTKCRPVRFGSASRVVRLIFRKRKCRCFGQRFVRTVLCRCRPHRLAKRCLLKTNTLLYSFEKFLPRPDRKACRRVLLVRKRRIRCQNKWRLVSKSNCINVFAKSVPVDCRCRLKFKKVKRRVRCRKAVTVRSGCHRKSCLRHVRVITFVKHLCHCVRHDRVRLVQCCKPRCPPPRTHKSRCHDGLVKVRTVWFRWIHSKCKRFEKKSVAKFVLKCHYKKLIPVGPCQHGLQLFKIVTKVPSKCQCVERHLTVQRRCGHPKK